MADEINTPPQIPSEQSVNPVPIKRNKKMLVFLGLIICAIIAGVVIKLLLQDSSNKKKQPAPTTTIGQQRPPTVAEQADKINFQGDYAGSQKFLDDHIAQSTDKSEQGKLYETKALFALNAKKYDESLGFGQKAEATNATRNSAVLIAKAAEALQNKSLAAEYYKKVLDRSPASTTEDDRQYYENKIKVLGG